MDVNTYEKAEKLYREIRFLQSLEHRIKDSDKLILGMEQKDGVVFYEDITKYSPAEYILAKIHREIEAKNKEFEEL